MKTIVCGAGTMGRGIAQVAAAAGYSTILYDLDGKVLEQAASKLQGDLQKLVDKQKMKEETKKQILNQLQFTSVLNDCRGDLIIEAIIERPDIKTELFRQLDSINSPETIFASNTSSLSISALAAGIPHPERMAGLHFFNPAPVMKLVEIVRGDQTSEAVLTHLVAITKAMGKVPVVCKDAPGFIVNRVARPFYIESLRLAEEGLADFETIDSLLESQGFRMGPFRLMDLIGNDVNYAVSCSVFEQLGEPGRLRPSHLQKQLVDRGALGKKTGRGYYDY